MYLLTRSHIIIKLFLTKLICQNYCQCHQLYGIFSFGFAAGSLGGVLKAALVLNGTVAGPLLGVFLLGVFLPFVNSKVRTSYSVIDGL